MNFAETLKAKRIAAGLTTRELAEKANVAQPMIAKYETGATLPNIVTAKLLADAVGATLDELTEEESNGN